MTRHLILTLFLASATTAGVSQLASQAILPFKGRVQLTIVPDWPDSLDPFHARLSLDLRGLEAFPQREACFAWDSTRLEPATLRIHIAGRTSCPGFSFEDGGGLPALWLTIKTPQVIRLVLDRDSTSIHLPGPDGAHMDAFRIQVDPVHPRVLLPTLPVAAIPFRSASVYCVSSGTYPALCEGFVEALPRLVGGSFVNAMQYWREGVLPPYYEPFERADSAAFRRNVVFNDVDQALFDSITDRSSKFTGLFPEARVQITLASQHRFICEGGACKSTSMNVSIGY